MTRHIVAWVQPSSLESVPFPRSVARLNKRYTNRFIEPVVRLFSGFAVVTHRGRKSGVDYETPLFAFDYEGSLLVALTYGRGADWARNVAVGGGSVSYHSADRAIEHVSFVGRAEAWPYLPWQVRLALRVMRVSDFMVLHLADPV